MKTYTLVSKENELLTFDLPEKWDEVSVNKYRSILSLNQLEYPEINTVAAMSDTPVEFWKSYGNYPFFLDILEQIQFVNEAPNFLGKPSKKFKYKAAEYEMPDEPFYGNIAQYEDMKMIAIKVQDIYKNKVGDKIDLKDNLELIECYSLIARTFLYPIISKQPYDFHNVALFREDFDNEISIEYAVQIASFFLKKLNVLKLGTKTKSKISKLAGFLQKMVTWKGRDTMN